MTYSIVARDPATGEIGVAVQSHYFGVGSLVPWARAGVGVVATQSVVEPRYGWQGLRLLESGRRPAEALAELRSADSRAPQRQVAIMDATGRAAGFTGSACIGHAGESVSPNARAQANLVSSPRIWTAMTEAFEASTGTLGERLLHALVAAEDHGGDLRGRQAAAITVVRGAATGDFTADLVTDIRVDDSADPLGALAALLKRSTALDCLIRMLSAEGLLSGPFTASAAELDDALTRLDRAQELCGGDNREPAVWRGLLLARAGHAEQARAAFALARAANPKTDELVRQLARAGMWPHPADELDALLT
ncbi:DUF1028 domain-containing protein [Amycolatopsis jejuensis]|uniref:DUF1028 domain-containing protein n=1 Tax=Amycolatopsis jejuensis TaxID=330084 RepID=UPI000525D332|nr:DUF1028 domain-containing protein [Amycolatopsis jejuensis]